MYASADTLILAAEGYWIGEDVQSETYIMAYKLMDATATPIGVGKIPGILLNQFAMDEHNGYLRFATSIQERFRYVETGQMWERVSVADSDNMIVVLELPSSGTDLEEVGRLAGLGKEGENIFSVRFVGDRAFVVRRFSPAAINEWQNQLMCWQHSHTKCMMFVYYLTGNL
jgi:inhibitor of cysteine peptidase